MTDQIRPKAQLNQKVQEKISENDGKVVYKDSSQIIAIFPENRIKQAVSTYFEITERLNQKAELIGGRRLTVFRR
jgi:hypothetical protein